MKAREQRRPVMLKVRLRLSAGWSDGCIPNVSSRGMMIAASRPPDKGAYLEVRRGSNVIVGRVVWSGKHRFGMRTQDSVDIAALERDPERGAPRAPGRCAGGRFERRGPGRPKEHHNERSRLLGRAIEFGGVALAAGAAAITVAGVVANLFASPLRSVETALAGAQPEL